MGLAILGDILRDPNAHEADVVVYIPDDTREIGVFTRALLVQHGSHSDEYVAGYRYFLELGTIREVIDGLDAQLSEPSTPLQRLRAVSYYAEHDAFPDLESVLRGPRS